MFAREFGSSDVACWKASLAACSRAFLVGLGWRLLLLLLAALPLLGGWPDRVLLVDGVVDPPVEEEGPASAVSFVLVRLRCRTGGVTAPVSAKVLPPAAGVTTVGVPGVAAGVGG